MSIKIMKINEIAGNIRGDFEKVDLRQLASVIY